jgi:iron complex outermembrane receptor protein
VNDTFALRLAVNAESENSFYRLVSPLEHIPGTSNEVSDPGNLNQKDARLSALWKPNDSFQTLLKLSLDTNNTDGLAEQPNPYTFTPLPGVACPSGPPAGPCRSTEYSFYSGNPWVLNYYNPSNWSVRYWDRAASIETRYTLPSQVVLRTYFGLMDIYDGQAAGSYTSEVTGYSYGWDGVQNVYNGEVNLISPSTGPFTWIVGSHWSYQKLPSPAYIANYTPPYSPTSPMLIYGTTFIYNRQAAVFGQVSWDITSTLQLQVGGRENWDNNPNGGAQYIAIPGLPLRVLGSPGTYKGSTPTGKVGLNWQATPNEYVYAFYARGYQPGAGTLIGPPAQPAHVNDYELGLKSTLLGGRLRTQIGGYWAGYQGMQISLFNAQLATGAELNNLPQATIKGLEVNAQSQLGQWGLSLSGAYVDSALGSLSAIPNYKFPTGFGNTPQCAPGVVSPTCTNYSSFYQTVSGEEAPFAPKLTATASVDYGIRLGNDMVTPRINFTHTDKQYGCIFQTDQYCYMGARNLLGANLDFTAGPWQAGLYGTNLTNQTYISTNTGAASVFYGAPRQVGFQVRYSE